MDDLGRQKLGIAPICPTSQLQRVSCGDDGVGGQWIPLDRRGLADAQHTAGEYRSNTAPTATEE